MSIYKNYFVKSLKLSLNTQSYYGVNIFVVSLVERVS